MERHKAINIKQDVYNKVAARARKSGFKSADEYVDFVLKQILDNLEEEQPQETRSKDDEEEVKARLRALGYLD